MPTNTRDWSQFALLLIDVQEDFFRKETQKYFPNFQDNVAKLLAFCRNDGLEVVHVRAVFKQDMSDWIPTWKLKGFIPCVENTEGINFLPCAAPKPGEHVVTKHSHDAFLNTDLLQYLRARNKKFLITAGLSTTVCVFLTTATASQLGFMTAIVEDCSGGEPEAHYHQMLKNDLYYRHVTLEQIPEKYPEWVGELKRLEEIDRKTRLLV